MKKIIIVGSLIVICITGSYYYFESKTTKVLLVGEVVGFEINNLDTDTELVADSGIIPTSSKSVGTITFVDENTKRFAALGHSISNNKEELKLTGNCYRIDFGYVKKSTNNSEGKIIADINEEGKLGYLDSSNRYGLFGRLENITKSKYKTMSTANRLDVKKGTAYICIDFDGSGLKEYEVEVTEINYFTYNENIRILVKSEELINKAGGIAQGMSGAPLIQNGKLIGAINCVNSENSLDAYAIFIDKLI